MKSNLISVSLLSCFVVLVVGCNKSAGDTSQEAQNQVTAQGNPAVQDATYQGACVSSTIPDVGPLKFPGMQTYFEMSAFDFTKHVVYYSDATCQTVAFEVREKGNIHVVGKSALVGGALDEDYNFTQTTVLLENDTIIAGFNLATVCGINDWAKGTERDTSTQSGTGVCPGKASPRKTADVALVENGVLFLGADADSAATTARPSQVDRSKPYAKK